MAIKKETYETMLVKECRFYPKRYKGRTLAEKWLLMIIDEGGGNLTNAEFSKLSSMSPRAVIRRFAKLKKDSIIEITYSGHQQDPNSIRTIKTIRKPPVRT